MLDRIRKALGFTPKVKAASPSVGDTTAPSHEPPADSYLADLLIEVAQEFEDLDRFRAAAQSVASRLTFDQAKDLTRFFHRNPPEPDALADKTQKYGIFGVWMNICQDAIFEVLFQYKAAAIPTLNTIAFGDYDWTQYKAIDILCRLAAEGIQTQETVHNIGDKIAHFRYEAVFPSLASLASIPANDDVPKIILGIFDQYAEEDPIDGLHILQLLAPNYPHEAKAHLAFLKAIAQGKGIENRSPLLDGAIMSIDADGNESYYMNGVELEGNFEERHRIHAAVLFYQLDQEDPEINQLLADWEQHAANEGHRDGIRGLRSGKG